MTKGIQKSYTLNCSQECPCTFPHIYALLRHCFKQLLSKILCQNFQVSKYLLKVLIKFYRFTNIYDLKIFDNETMALWIFFFFFETCTKERFASSVLSNEGNIIASILLIPLKCIASGYESFTGKLLSKYVPLKMLFHFFRYLIYSAFHKTFAKNLWKNYPFLAEISKIHFKMYITGNYDV